MDEKCEMLRHTVATLAYRATRALEGAPEDFAEFNGAGRMPVKVLAHMGDLFDWQSRFWQIGPSITLPIFEGGRNTANLRAAQARYREQVDSYHKQVLVVNAEQALPERPAEPVEKVEKAAPKKGRRGAASGGPG